MAKAKVADGLLESEMLSAIVAEVEGLDSERDALIRESRELRFGENSINLPKSIDSEIVRSNIAYTVVEHVVGSLTSDEPVITVPPATESSKDQERSSTLERSTTLILKELERQQGESIKDRYVESVCADGHGAMRMLYAPQLWKGFPKRSRKDDEETDEDYIGRVDTWKKGAKLPIHWMWLDPLTVHPIWGESGLVGVVEHDQRHLADLGVERWNINDNRAELLELSRAQSGSATDTVDFVQYWTPKTLTYSVNGQVVHHVEHKYQRPPYVITTGISPSVRDRKYSGLSVLFPLLELVPYLDRLLSQIATGIRLWNWPTPVIKVDPARHTADDGSPINVVVKPGETVALYQSEDISFLMPQGMSPESSAMIQLIYSMIQRAGLSDVFYGQTLSGDSGYLVNQLLAAARVKFRPIVSAVERGMEQIVLLVWDIIEYYIKDRLYVYSADKKEKANKWYSLAPEDINGYRQVKVSVTAVLPTDTYAISSRVINEVGAGMRDIASGMEEIGIAQPDEMKRKIMADRIMASPGMQAVFEEEVARRYGLKKQSEQPTIGAEQLMNDWGNFPPALQQAITAYAAAQANGGAVPGSDVMAAPNVQAVPQPTGNTLGRQVRPAGIATGQAPGVQRQGNYGG